MKVLFNFIFLLILSAINHAAGMSTLNQASECRDQNSGSSIRVFSNACLDGKAYQIHYDRKITSVVLEYGKKKIVLQKVPKRFDPTLVGSDVFIGFLPDNLQLYKDSSILAFVSSIRTSGGNGGGQCGAGAEIFLNFLDVQKAAPKILSSILIGSCDEAIELMDQDMSKGELGELSVMDKKLNLRFMYYRGKEGSPTATVSPDLKNLQF